MTLRRTYRKAPIAEAICEFKFEPGKPWDWTIPGIIYGKIKAEFPDRQQQNSLEVTLGPKEGVVSQQVTGTLSRMQFLRADKSAMVQVGADLLAVNVLPPYPGWGDFEELITRNLEIYREEAGPTGVRRIGVRYINRFLFPSPEIELMDYFNLYPHIPDPLEQRHGPFSMRVMFTYADERDALTVRMGHLPEGGGIALDLDYYLAKPRGVELKGAVEWVRGAHNQTEKMFEACITDGARALCAVEDTK
jgi:uncharacterized protein (TIGR04255 family)